MTAGEAIVDSGWASREWTLRGAVRTYRFWCLFASWVFIWGIATTLTLAHLVVYATDIGYTATFGATVFSLYGILYGVANGMGFLSDRLGREVTGTIGIGLAAVGVCLLIINPGAGAPVFMYGFAVLFGVGLGIASPALTSATADIFQGKHFGSIYGLTIMGFGIGGSLGPWLGGRIFDMYGTYIPAFLVVVGSLGLAALNLWLAAPRKVRLVPGRAPKKPVIQ